MSLVHLIWGRIPHSSSMPLHTATAIQAVRSTASRGEAGGAQKDGEIEPRAPGRLNRLSRRPPAGGLLLGQHSQPGGRALGPQLFQIGIGGIHLLQALDLPAPTRIPAGSRAEMAPALSRSGLCSGDNPAGVRRR